MIQTILDISTSDKNVKQCMGKGNIVQIYFSHFCTMLCFQLCTKRMIPLLSSFQFDVKNDNLYNSITDKEKQ